MIVLDQFPRNMFRNSARAFEADQLARDVADIAISQGFDKAVDKEVRAFFYLPFMHSEEIEDQDYCVELCRALGDENNLKYAEMHADIIRRFGRFPHRNDVLGRETTPQEQGLSRERRLRGLALFVSRSARPPSFVTPREGGASSRLVTAIDVSWIARMRGR